MKRIPKTTLLLISLIFPLSSALAKYSGGAGTPDDPYIIADVNDLHTLADDTADYDKHFQLTADIDLDPNLPNRRIYTAAVIAPDIGTHSRDVDDIQPKDINTPATESDFRGIPFSGTFDGNGHSILNLTVAAADSQDYLSLFGLTDPNARIICLSANDISITAGQLAWHIGGLCAYNQGIILNCRTTGSITAGYYSSRIGGLCGVSHLGFIANSCSTVSVKGGPYSFHLGGFCGWNTGFITNCSAAGPVTGADNSRTLGGFCGVITRYGSQNCYSVGAVTAGQNSNYVGGYCGQKFSAHIYDCFWDIETSGTPASDAGTGLTTAEMTDPQNFINAGWDLEGESQNGTASVWTMSQGKYPELYVFSDNFSPHPFAGAGDETDPYQLWDSTDLAAISQHPSACYKLMEDVDLSGVKWPTAPVPFFSGRFDGNNKTISTLTIDGYDNLALFAFIDPSGSVFDLTLVNVSITGNDTLAALCATNRGTLDSCSASGSVRGDSNIGGLCAFNYSGPITDAAAEVDITGGLSYNHGHGSYALFLGGLCGYNERGNITNSHAVGNVIAEDDSMSVGGLCGMNLHAAITNCHATGSLVVTDNNIEAHCFGGLCGANRLGLIEDSYATGNVTGTHRLGGLCGLNSGVIANSFAKGNVNGEVALGGLCGANDNGSINDCYSSGTVTGDWRLGGLCGINEGNSGIIRNSCATGSVSGDRRVGGLCGENDEAAIKNCYCAGNVTANYSAGGFCADNSNARIENSYTVSLVTGNTNTGAFCGYNSGSFSACFHNHDINPSLSDTYQSDDPNIFAVPLAQMSDLNMFLSAGWDFADETANGAEDTWFMPSAGAPRLWHQPDNSRPVADAGPDRTIYLLDDISALAEIDARSSYDPDGDTLRYRWDYVMEVNDVVYYPYFCSNPTRTINGRAGQYSFRLTVNDGYAESEPDFLTLTFAETNPSVTIFPQVINRRSNSDKDILVRLTFPAQLADYIDFNSALTLSPGDIESHTQYLVDVAHGKYQGANLFALFDSTELLNAIDENGQLTITVSGQLTTGKPFSGSDSVWIKGRPSKP